MPPRQSTRTRTLPPSSGSDVVDERLRAGVVLSVRVTGHPELSAESVRISSDGTIFLPRIRRVAAGGLTPQQLANKLEATFRGDEGGARFLKSPEVNVQVLERGGRLAYVVGQVGSPGAIPLPVGQVVRLSQLVALAGGLSSRANSGTLAADPTALKLHRKGADGKIRVYQLSFQDVVERGDVEADVSIQDGDLLVVPPKEELFIYGSVRNPGGYALAAGSRLGVDEALGLCGGFTENAERDRLLLIRRGPDGARTYRIPSDPAPRAKVEVTANDTIIVPGRTVRRVYVIGSVGSQGGYPLDEPDLTVTKLLALAGGLDRIAAGNSVLLIRGRQAYRVPVADMIATGDLTQDPVLQPGDVISVPESFF